MGYQDEVLSERLQVTQRVGIIYLDPIEMPAAFGGAPGVDPGEQQ